MTCVCPRCGQPGPFAAPCTHTPRCAALGCHAIPIGPAADPRLGFCYGPYLVLRPLGQGGMATVYLAHDTRPQAPDRGRAALKIGARPREAGVLARLIDPGIVRLYAQGEEHGEHWLAMEYVEGRTLADVPGPLPTETVRDIIRQVGNALAAAHAIGLVHRDIKPANLVLQDRPIGPPLVRILDFGIARDLAEEGHTTTPHFSRSYAAPEQLGGEAPTDARTDVYALAVVAAELLTGRRPHPADLRRSGAGIGLDPLQELEDELTAPVLAVLRDALALAPANRPGLRTFLAGLDAALAPNAALAPEPKNRVETETSKRRVPVRWAWLLVLILGLWVWLALRPPSAPPVEVLADAMAPRPALPDAAPADAAPPGVDAAPPDAAPLDAAPLDARPPKAPAPGTAPAPAPAPGTAVAPPSRPLRPPPKAAPPTDSLESTLDD